MHQKVPSVSRMCTVTEATDTLSTGYMFLREL